MTTISNPRSALTTLPNHESSEQQSDALTQRRSAPQTLKLAVSSTDSSRMDAVLERLVSLVDLTDDLDEDFYAPTGRALEHASKVLKALALLADREPSVVPNGDGGVQLAWVGSDWSAYVNINADAALTWARGKDQGTTFAPVELSTGWEKLLRTLHAHSSTTL